MRTDDAASLRYLAEWYTPQLHGRPISDVARCLRRSPPAQRVEACPPELLYALEIPDEFYAFGVFAADSADAVAQLCQQAGLPADRVSIAVEAVEVDDDE
jgi:hypothetical protein